MGAISADLIYAFFKTLGEHYHEPGDLYLLGGSALCLLGSLRPTLDIDYASDVSSPDEALRAAMESVGREMALEIEAVSFGEFIPLPADANRRHRKVDGMSGWTFMFSIPTVLR